MKILITLLVVLGAVSASAKDYQDAAQKAFDNMTAEEAFDSNKFKTRVFNIQMPGTSTWFKPSTSLCINGDSVQTTYAFKTCTLWSAKDDGDTKTFKSKSKAEDWGSSVTCVASTSQIYSTPINYTVNQCVLWSAKDDGETKVFKSKYKAEDWGSSVKCVEKAMVAKRMPTSYKMEFYRNKVENDRYLGSHVYPIAQCDL